MNACEPQDMSIRSCTSPTCMTTSIQESPIMFNSAPLINMLSNPIAQMFLKLMGQVQTVQKQDVLPAILPGSKALEGVIQKTIQNQLPNKDSELFIRGELKITVGSNAPVTMKINSSSCSASKRKSCTPVRILQVLPPSSDCESTDSEALDLSRSGSVHSNVMSPITPGEPNFTRMLCKQYEKHDAPRKMSSCTKRRVSNGSRSFPCNQCDGKGFSSLQQLEEHTKFAHGGYRCHICSRTFTQRSNLQRHALKHVGFKPFQCGVCLQGYYRKDHLMKHMEVSHPTVNSRENVKVFLSPSLSLDYLQSTTQSTVNYPSSSILIGTEQPKFMETADRQSSHLY